MLQRSYKFQLNRTKIALEKSSRNPFFLVKFLLIASEGPNGLAQKFNQLFYWKEITQISAKSNQNCTSYRVTKKQILFSNAFARILDFKIQNEE